MSKLHPELRRRSEAKRAAVRKVIMAARRDMAAA
jgi:hypothetical protein